MNKTITVEFTDELLRRSQRHSSLLKLLFSLGLVFVALSVPALMIASFFGEEAILGALIGLVVVAILIGLTCWSNVLRARRESTAFLAKLPHRFQTYTFSDDQLLIEGPLGQSRLTWDMLERLERFKDVWHMHFLSQYYLLPAELVDEDLACFLEAKWQSKTAAPLRKSLSWRSPAVWVTTLVFAGVVLTLFLLAWRPGADGPAGQFTVEPDRPTLRPIAIREGQCLDLSVVVTSGAPVDVYIGREATFADKELSIRDTGIPGADHVRDLRRKVRWQHPGPAIIVISSSGRSEVSLQATVTQEP
jgi:hypothetical protein